MGFSLLGPLAEGSVRLPLCTFKIPAGFPSPATDHMEQPISLDEVLSLRAPHVYLVTIDGDSMQGVGIFSGDLAVVYRSIEAADFPITLRHLVFYDNGKWTQGLALRLTS